MLAIKNTDLMTVEDYLKGELSLVGYAARTLIYLDLLTIFGTHSVPYFFHSK